MKNVSPRLLLVVVGFALSISLVSAPSGAQSGRRAQKGVTAAPTPEPTTTPTDKPGNKDEKVVTFIVGVDEYHGFSNIPFSYYDSIARACAGRLDDHPAVRVPFAQKDMSRADAVRLAQGEKEAYVVWLRNYRWKVSTRRPCPR